MTARRPMSIFSDSANLQCLITRNRNTNKSYQLQTFCIITQTVELHRLKIHPKHYGNIKHSVISQIQANLTIIPGTNIEQKGIKKTVNTSIFLCLPAVLCCFFFCWPSSQEQGFMLPQTNFCSGHFSTPSVFKVVNQLIGHRRSYMFYHHLLFNH